MQGKTVVITGATSGIGEVAAVELARMGARVVFVARNPKRRDATLARLLVANPKVKPSAYIADLSRLADAKRVAGEIAAAEPVIDVLINNAGAVFGTREETADGLELTFATNHMAYFVLTNLLLPQLKAAKKARIVSTASGAHRRAHLDFDDLQSTKKFSGFDVYSKSKLCNVLFTAELARRLKGPKVTANCLHPGVVATRFADDAGGLIGFGFGLVKKFSGLSKKIAISPEEGAKTIIYLTSSPEVAGKTGGYYDECKLVAPSAEAQDIDAAKRLWEVSAKIAGVG